MTLTQTIRSSLIPSAASRPADDPIFLLNAEATRRAQAGEKVINATLGALLEDDGTLAILPSAVEALARVPAKKAAAYAPILGARPFLDAVVRDTFDGADLASLATASATPGGTGAIYQALTCFLEPGQALLTTHWFWSPYQTLATHARRAVETFETFDARGRFDTGGFAAGLDRLIQRQGRALAVLNFPCHNPTGYSLDAAEWREVAEIVRKAGERAPVALLVDLAYARFGGAGSNGWIEQVPRVLESATLLVAWTASKSFAQYGARVGALVAAHADPAERSRIQNALAFACRGTWSNCNHGGQLAVAELLEDPVQRARADQDRARLVRLLDERVQVWNREAARAGLRHPRYEGGFFVSVFAPDAEAAAERLRAAGVFVVPLPGALRVALCSTPVAEVPRLVAALREAIR
ncbi:MAG: aminotransferase class I/II-fold pyridoxal phosphate-dependent enzyme [Planctomycetes bacterium]|nr:aminotransferase class I/II-fold pyridoxal phosphate-dependent enzyme [Planctomycetota bacterium]